MSTGFERGVAYRPRFSMEGRPIPSPDEDPFTLAVAAFEAGPARPGASPPARVHLVGEYPAGLDWAFAAYFGSPVELTRHPGGGAGLLRALREAASAEGDRPYLVLAVDAGGPQGTQSAALWFGPDPSEVVLEWDSVVGIEGAAALARAVLLRSTGQTGAHPPGPALGPPWPEDRARAFSQSPPSQVSEGAYVPRPRYLDNLPSRWRLEADRCAACGRTTFPRRGACRFCGRSDRLSRVNLPRDDARVVAVTVLAPGGQPTEFDAQVAALGGYGVVLAEFEPDVRLTLQVTDAAPGEVRIGDSIGTRLRRLYPMEGEWRYGRKAVPRPELAPR